MKKPLILGRRQFLAAASLATAALSMAGISYFGKAREKLHKAPKKRLAFFSTYLESDEMGSFVQGLKKGGKTSLYLLDPESLELEQFQLPMLIPHSLIQNPVNKNIVVVAPRDQTDALVLDLSTGEVLARLISKAGDRFHGHGFFSPNGESLFVTGYDVQSIGFLREYDLNWRLVRTIDSYGLAPHDVRTVDDGQVLIVANNGWNGSYGSYQELRMSSVSYVETKTGRLIEKVEVPKGHLALQHFECNDRGDLVVGCDFYGPNKSSSEYESLVGHSRRGEPLRFLEIDPEMKRRLNGNILSIKWDQVLNRVVTTTPEGPVTVWDLSEMKASHQLMNETHPHGVEFNSSSVFVTTANAGIFRAPQMESSKNQELVFEKIQLPPIQNIIAHATWLESA